MQVWTKDDGEGGRHRRSSFVRSSSSRFASISRAISNPYTLTSTSYSLPLPVDWKTQLAVADQAQTAFGVGQRVAGDDLLDVGGFGGRLLEELEAGRHVGEEVLHRDQRAGRPATRLAADLAALGQADQRAGLLVA